MIKLQMTALGAILSCAYSLCGQMNETALENTNAGTTAWQLTNPANNREIEGYASLTSVKVGGSIGFFVSTAAPSYTMDIYRLGWYGGNGGRQMVTTIPRTGILQTTPTVDSFGRFECNWTSPYTLPIPTNWVSGVYLVKLTASTGLQSYIQFVVREDARLSAILFQHSVTTDEAYNNWPGPAAGGKSLYTFNSSSSVAAVKVSFNRPYLIDTNPVNNVQVGAGFLLRWEVMMLRWMEKKGYDVAYCTSVDTHENGSALLTHKAFLSVGHDEYWSWEMRANVEAARDSGVNIAFFSSDPVYWQIRLETSPINGATDRTITAYKETAVNDPVTNPCLLTTMWRKNSCKPSEQALIGVEYIETSVGCPSTSTCTDMVIADGSSWALAGSGLTTGSHIYGILGYEVDGQLDTDSPPGTALIAKSPIPILNSDASSHPFSDMVTYTAASGATVVAVGTMQWSWGLDDWGAPAQRPSILNPAVQVITENVLARFVPATSGSGPPVSDDFNSGTVNTKLWTAVSPSGGSYSVNGTDLLLTVPGGSNHDPTFGGADNSIRVVQPANGSDFIVEVKFDSIPRAQYQFEGVLVDQDSANYLRFQFGSTQSQILVGASSITAQNETGRLASVISIPNGATSLWLRVQKSGSVWTQFWSADGVTYNNAGSFTQALAVSDIGPFAGNYSPNPSASPAFTAAIDYFHNTTAVSGPVSDNFDATRLNTSLWTVENPVGDGSYSLNGSELLLSVPAASNHDPSFGGSDNSLRVVQAGIGAGDFTVKVKFDTIPISQYQFEGIVVEQDPGNYLRFQLGSTGSSLMLGASKIVSHAETFGFGSVISIPNGTTSIWILLQKVGSTWTQSWSTDGSTFNTAGSLVQPLTISGIGPFAGNYNATTSAAPAFTAAVDYFFNTASPLAQ